MNLQPDVTSPTPRSAAADSYDNTECEKLIDVASVEGDEDDDDGDYFGVQQVQGTIQPKPVISDKCNLVYFSFLLFGLSSVIPWNFFITANGYWMYKFRNVSTDEPLPLDTKSELQVMFSSYLSIASMIPSTTFLLINTLISSKVHHEVRSNVALAGMLILFTITAAFAKINVDDWQNEFFIITMVTVVLTNSFVAVFQGAVMGIANAFPAKFMQALMNGQAVGAIFASLVNIISIRIGVSPENIGIIYFCFGILTLIITTLTHCALRKVRFYRHYITQIKDAEDRAATHNMFYGLKENRIAQIFKKIWVYGFCAIFIFGGTLAVFPAVAVLVISENAYNGSPLTNQYFIPVCCFLIFNLGDLTGRVVASVVPKGSVQSSCLPFLSAFRLLLVFGVMLCNAQPRHHLPLLFSSDVYYILIMLFLGLTNGYLINLTVIYAARKVTVEFREIAGAMMAFFLGIGLAVGALISEVLVKCL